MKLFSVNHVLKIAEDWPSLKIAQFSAVSPNCSISRALLLFKYWHRNSALSSAPDLPALHNYWFAGEEKPQKCNQCNATSQAPPKSAFDDTHWRNTALGKLKLLGSKPMFIKVSVFFLNVNVNSLSSKLSVYLRKFNNTIITVSVGTGLSSQLVLS